jgi:hypothetical protein
MPRLNATHRRIAFLVSAGILSSLAGCSDKSVTSYRVPKEPGSDQVPAAAAEASAPAAATSLSWATPAGWQVQPATGMRQGSFTVAGPGGAAADVSVVSFPGSGGDDLANINRWRDQVKLAPISAAELPSQVQSLSEPAGQFVFADFTGAAGDKGATRLLGAWLRQPDHVWFFKMMGPADLVGSQKDAFVAFLQSVTLPAGPGTGPSLAQGAPNASNTNDLPRNDMGGAVPPASAAPPGGGMDSVPVQAEGGDSLLWQAPPDWKDEPGKPMRKGSYGVAGGAEVAITAFPGDVGGVLANVNRWRGQAGLDPVDDAGLAQATTAIESNGLHFLLVDVSNGSSPLVAALVPWNGGTWFFKLTGSADAVTRAKPAFLAFLKTVRSP